jgi:ketosteroid isomerase-like protein
MTNTTSPDRKAAAQILDNVLASWNAAMASWNVDQIVEVYDENTLFLGSTPPLHKGRAGVRSYFEGIPGERSVLELFEMEVVVLDAKIIVASGYAKFESVIGGNAIINNMRISLTLVLRDSDWKIASHHVSPRAQ